MNILVTGATGFIGSHLTERLLKKNRVVTIIRDMPSHRSPWGTWVHTVMEKVILVGGDIRNTKKIERILSDYQIDQVYHIAAQPIVATAIKNPCETLDSNIMGTVSVLEACRRIEVNRILVMSTDKVYGNRLNATTKAPLVSGGIYETSKAAQDLIAQTYQYTYGMSIVIPRSCNAYGFDFSPRIIPNTIRACLRGEQPFIYAGEETLRQYIFIDDLTVALTQLMNAGYDGVFNVANEEDPGKTQADVVTEICKHFSVKPTVKIRIQMIKEIQNQSIVASEFAWRPEYTFEEGITKTIAKFKKFGWT